MRVEAREKCARLCGYSTSRLSAIGVLLFCLRFPRGISPLFAVAVSVWAPRFVQRLCVAAMAPLSACCDLCDRRTPRAYLSGMTASGTRGLSGCVEFGVTRTRCCA
jgi:hypothetical protein